MQNNFFTQISDQESIRKRILEIESGKVGLYSVGLYAASLAYNCAMQTSGESLLLAPRPHREILGAFDPDSLNGMDKDHVSKIIDMGTHYEGSNCIHNNLADLILRCELVILSANSKHVEEDLKEACALRLRLNRQNVVLACLAGSFSHDKIEDDSYILCEKEPNLAFFSGFHRHDALRNPLDSFTANFCHPDSVTALFGSRLLDKISPNIQVSPGVHNIEAQYIKAAKNMSSIFAGFGYRYHENNPGVLPTLLTLLLEQCLDQAASVSMSRIDRDDMYNKQPFPLTELGYGVQKIEAALLRDGDMKMVRDHTFAQLTAMVADVRGSMMMPVSGKPTRNFQAGIILAQNMSKHERCPKHINELYEWCEASGLSQGGLEGLKALEFWPQIANKYLIPLHDSSMINLLYMSIYGTDQIKENVFIVMTQSRELTNYCQESVRPSHSRRFAEALNNLDNKVSMDLIVKTISIGSNNSLPEPIQTNQILPLSNDIPIYVKAMNLIEDNMN